MLIIYTPHADSDDEVRQIIDSTLLTDRLPRRIRRTSSSLGLVVDSSWCRELVVGLLHRLTTNLPPGSLTIHGIRKHGDYCSNQPSRVIGHVSRTNKMVDSLLTTFFQMMTEMIDCTMSSTGPMSPERVNKWTSMWNYLEPHAPGGGMVNKVTCTLNTGALDISDIPGGFNTETIFGTIANIPSHWALSPAVMGYMLLIPRLWSLFYGTPRILGRLTSIGTRSRSTPLLTLLGLNGAPRTLFLWSMLARKLMLPFWLSTFGKSEFWFFTYLLIYEALGEGESIPGFGNLLRKEPGIDGFGSWCRWFNRRESNLPWISTMLEILKTDQVMSCIRLGTLCTYI